MQNTSCASGMAGPGFGGRLSRSDRPRRQVSSQASSQIAASGQSGATSSGAGSAAGRGSAPNCRVRTSRTAR